MTASRPLSIIILLSAMLAVGITAMNASDPATHVNGNGRKPVADSVIDDRASTIPTITVIGKRTGHVEQHALTTTSHRA